MNFSVFVSRFLLCLAIRINVVCVLHEMADSKSCIAKRYGVELVFMNMY